MSNQTTNTINNRFLTKYTVNARFQFGSTKATAQTFTNNEVDITLDTIRVPNHGYLVGDNFDLTTAGTLPTGLSITTAYYVIVKDSSTIQVATSRANAIAGTAVDLTGITGALTVVHTINVNALGTLKSGVIIPKNHVIINSVVVQTVPPTALATTGTIAVQALAANDILTASAISGAPWSGVTIPIKATPISETASTWIVMTSDSEVQCLLGVSRFITGEINVFLDVLACE